MIVRIVGEGQFQLPDDALANLDPFDDAVEQAVAAEDSAALTTALQQLHEAVVAAGSPLADDVLQDSDLIIPAEDATLSEVQAMLEASDEGLIPNS